MSEQQSEPAGIRAHLLNIEPPDVERLRKLQLEIQMMFTKPLTPATRASWMGTLLTSLIFACIGMASLWKTIEPDVTARAAWTLFSVLMLGNAAFAGYVLRSGVVDSRKMAAVQKLSVPATLLVAIVILIQYLDHPTTAGIGWVLFALMAFILALAVLLYNRIVSAELTTREALLRLELRMVELAERGAAKAE